MNNQRGPLCLSLPVTCAFEKVVGLTFFLAWTPDDLFLEGEETVLPNQNVKNPWQLKDFSSVNM